MRKLLCGGGLGECCAVFRFKRVCECVTFVGSIVQLVLVLTSLRYAPNTTPDACSAGLQPCPLPLPLPK
jgi:hypothetical protein